MNEEKENATVNAIDFKLQPISSTVKISKCNSFQVTTHLLNRENLKVAIAQLCHELQVYNFTII